VLNDYYGEFGISKKGLTLLLGDDMPKNWPEDREWEPYDRDFGYDDDSDDKVKQKLYDTDTRLDRANERFVELVNNSEMMSGSRATLRVAMVDKSDWKNGFCEITEYDGLEKIQINHIAVKLHQELTELRAEHVKLKNAYHALYYSPNPGPGYTEARKGFNIIIEQKRSKTIS